MNIAFYTLGCKVNQYETEVMREAFENKGHTVVNDSMPFDVIIINSCTVTAESDRKTRQAVHRFRRQHPNAVIVLTGCMAQAFSEDAKALLDADIVIGNTDVSKIYNAVQEYLENEHRIFAVLPHPRDERFNTPSINSFAERTRAYMKIQDGCDRFCIYYVVVLRYRCDYSERVIRFLCNSHLLFLKSKRAATFFINQEEAVLFALIIYSP